MMKKIKCSVGVIGGLGNEAMVDLADKIAAIPGHERRTWVFFGNSRLAYKPDELGAMGGGRSAVERRREATAHHTIAIMQHLGCDLAGVACNSAHELFREVVRARSIPFVDMLRSTARSIPETRGSVLVMGVTSLMESGLYQEALKECGHTPVVPSEGNQARIMDAIYNTSFGLKTGQVSRESEHLLCEALDEECRRQGCSHVILGCTEIPLVFTPENCSRLRDENRIPAVRIVDGSNVLAQALVSTPCVPGDSAPDVPLPGQDVDWFPPAAFEVASLKEMVSIQHRVFRQTDEFLLQQGLAVKGSYMHLPTLFLVGRKAGCPGTFRELNIELTRPQSGKSVVPESTLKAHFDSLS